MNKGNYVFHRYILLVLMLIIFFPNNCGADWWSDRREAVEGGIRDPRGTVTNESIRIRDQVSTYLGQGLTPPIVREYFTYLENQGNGRWKALPDRLRHILTPKYVKAFLSEVRYAENINTIHGQGITVGNNIYFTQSINLNNPTDMHWLLHELEHVSQYNVHGGKEAFLVKYLANGALQIGRGGSFNIHDVINLETDAENKANRIQQQVWDEWTASPVQPPPQTRQSISPRTASPAQSQPQISQPPSPPRQQGSMFPQDGMVYPSGYGMKVCGCWGPNPGPAAEPRCASGWVRVNVCQGAMCAPGHPPYAFVCQ